MPNNQDKTRTVITRLDERVGLPYSAFLAAGSGVTLTYDPAAGTVTVSDSGLVQGAVSWTAIVSPAALPAGATNNWAPNLTGINRINATTTAPDSSVTGIAGGTDGRRIIITNLGPGSLTLIDAGGSVAANQFALGGSNITIEANTSRELFYQGAPVNRWTVLSPG